MSKLISAINITPDGFCDHGNVIADEEHHQFAISLLKNSDIALFGRVTYQLFESYWPRAAKDRSLQGPVFEFARLIDETDKVVVSQTLQAVSWGPASILGDLNTKSIQRLKNTSKKNIIVFGSPGLVSGLTELGLVDEYYFSVQPMMAGAGKHFFETTSLKERCRLKLIDTRQFQSGVVTLCFQNVQKN